MLKRPLHLKDLISPSAGGGGWALLLALTSFITIILEVNTPSFTSLAKSLLAECKDSVSCARLLATSCSKESGGWLNALLISALSLRLDDDTVRIAVGLRLGIPLCKPHTCCMCGANVDCTATHGLSCQGSPGRHHNHAAINTIIHRALSAAHIPSHLEPSGLDRSDGKCPDGATIMPWKYGKMLVWDVTCLIPLPLPTLPEQPVGLVYISGCFS